MENVKLNLLGDKQSDFLKFDGKKISNAQLVVVSEINNKEDIEYIIGQLQLVKHCFKDTIGQASST